MLSLLIIKFHVIHLNPASCKCCNTVPQTLLLDSHGYSPYPKKFTMEALGNVSFICYRADGNVYLFGSLAMCRTLESWALFWQAITRFI